MDNKIIKEMAKDLKEEKLYALINKTSYMRSAENLYDLGYRKIDKDSVVLSREEFEAYTFIKHKWGNQDAIKWSELVDDLYEFARKFSQETAGKILNELYCTPKEQVEKRIKELAEWYDVEVKE